MKHPNFHLQLSIYVMLFATVTAFAQDANELRQREAKINEAQLNRVYENNLPNKKSSGIGSGLSLNEIEKLKQQEQQSQNEAAERAESAARDAVSRTEDQENKHRSVTSAEARLEPIRSYLGSQTQIQLYDRVHWYGDLLLVEVEGFVQGYKALDYQAASTSLDAFTSSKETADYEPLTYLLWQARLLPLSAIQSLAILNDKYPGRQQATEKLELKLWPFVFGANRPYLHPKSGVLDDFKYPTSMYEDENIPVALRRQWLDRFIALAQKYPEEARIAAGFFRPHLNPFMLYAQTNGQLDKATREELYWQALHIRNAKPKVDYETEIERSFGDYAEKNYRLANVLEWLADNSNERLKSLSAADWLELAERKNVRIFDLGVSTQLRNGRWKSLEDRYKNYGEAVKIGRKAWEDSLKTSKAAQPK